MSARVAVITGAARGIGRAIAERLAADGCQTVLVDLDESVEKTAAEVGGRALRCDVSDPAAVHRLVGELDRVDSLINNAGVWQFSSLADITPEHFHRVMSVNVLGSLLLTQAIAPLITKQGGGAIVNLTSILATVPRANSGIYPATKAAVVALTRQAALEYADAGIRVNAVGPGFVRTEGARNLFGGTAAEEARRGATLPLGRLGEPGDVADTVAFLTSDAARYITGQVIYCDGGLGLGTLDYLHQAWGLE